MNNFDADTKSKPIELHFKINPLYWKLEKFTKRELEENAPTPIVKYAMITDETLEKIYKKTCDKYTNRSYNFSQGVIISIRANKTREYIMHNFKKLKLNLKNIIKDYSNQMGIFELVNKYDGSPLNILRLIFDKKYKRKLTELIKNLKLLDSRDREQLKIAMGSDAYALVDQQLILQRALNFEMDIQQILKKLNIKFRTQDQLVKEQKKNFLMQLVLLIF